MSKKEAKDPHAVVLIRRLLQIIDLGMIEDLQEAEQTMNVSRNLEIAGDLGTKKGKNFFSKSSEKINKILHKSGGLLVVLVFRIWKPDTIACFGAKFVSVFIRLL